MVLLLGQPENTDHRQSSGGTTLPTVVSFDQPLLLYCSVKTPTIGNFYKRFLSLNLKLVDANGKNTDHRQTVSPFFGNKVC